MEARVNELDGQWMRRWTEGRKEGSVGGYIAGPEAGWKDEGERMNLAIPSLPPLGTARAGIPSSAWLFSLHPCRCPSRAVMKTEMHKVIFSSLL